MRKRNKVATLTNTNPSQIYEEAKLDAPMTKVKTNYNGLHEVKNERKYFSGMASSLAGFMKNKLVQAAKKEKLFENRENN